MNWFTLLLVVSLNVCFSLATTAKIMTPSSRMKCTGVNVCEIEGTTLKFFLIGDTGGNPIFGATYAQNKVAQSMASANTDDQYSFIINTGDLIYWNGVNNIHDDRFEKTFENTYDLDNLLIPFYMVYGNHDYLGDIDAMVEYTNFSNKWTFPAKYYTINYAIAKTVKVSFIMLDTIELCGNTVEMNKESSKFEWFWAKQHSPKGPDNSTAADIQWEWIKTQLRTNTANYLFVVGHYPIYSASNHGPTNCMLEKLDPLLRQYNVTAYFSGHDHNLQDISHFDKTTNTNMQYIISGAGAYVDRSMKNKNSIPSGSLKYFYPPSKWNVFSTLGLTRGAYIDVSITEKEASFQFMRGDNEKQHSLSLPSRQNE
uniref:Tartrate-resistant acid phosphatase type 5 n=1 Tax=Rhabditophanes sp. KR3021 TaxID=114890 RepID=A0AC35U4X6_9BILA